MNIEIELDNMKIRIEQNDYGVNKNNVWKLQSFIPKDLYKYLIRLTNNIVNDLFFKTLFQYSKDIYFYCTKDYKVLFCCKNHGELYYKENDLIKIDLEETFTYFSLDDIEETIEKTYKNK